ncbi:hypothetical protein PAL_GLEAN10008642 [Pteropus alecto]|uniref:Uncharacterized protein n=1 Tax=Pteropus alecto TaxID=9402 RepID=L5KY73_PTEAL|nr:hypothetical protein PAL_GLEAN10008642 [Pteropus alecto]
MNTGLLLASPGSPLFAEKPQFGQLPPSSAQYRGHPYPGRSKAAARGLRRVTRPSRTILLARGGVARAVQAYPYTTKRADPRQVPHTQEDRVRLATLTGNLKQLPDTFLFRRP